MGKKTKSRGPPGPSALYFIKEESLERDKNKAGRREASHL